MAIATGVLAVVTGVVVGAVYWHRSTSYSPPRFAGYYGPQPGRPIHVAAGHRAVEDYELVGPQGITQDFEWGLINDGDHDVTITRADFTSARTLGRTRVLDRLTWSPYRADPSRLLNGLPEPSQSFPADLPAHGQINIRFRMTKPSCASVPAGVFVGVSEQIRLHWKALVNSHTTTVGPDGTIALCG